MPERSAEERERARLEREARRAAREGRAAPARPSAATPAPVPPPAPEPEPRPEPAAPPPATGREWRQAAGEPDPDPPLVRRIGGRDAAGKEAIHADEQPLPEPAPVEPPTRRIPPAPTLPFGEGEQALGTKRLGAGHRGSRPHLPQRRAKTPRAAPAARPPAARRRGLRRVLALLVLVVLAVIIWLAISIFQPFGGGSGSGRVTVTIGQGETISQTADDLAAKHVIGSAFFFKLRARISGRTGDIKAGRHVLARDMSYGAALDALSSNPPAPRVIKLTIPEGKSRGEIAPLAKQAGLKGDYLAASRASPALAPRRFGAPRGSTLEGFLFPATYQLPPGAPVKRLVAEQLAAFRQNIAGVDLKRAHGKNLSTYDVLVIASMIEREAGIAKDRPLIAAVIYNRLKDGMPLGIDATLRYALHDWTRPLTVSELASNSPYNTRKHTGLPPTPIGNPGLASIRAAARPAHVSYLFYVIKPCGNGAHAFSSTDAQFEHDVAAYNAKRDQLGGKSPVTCK